MKYIIAACIVVTASLPGARASLSEQKALVSGLEHRYELKILRVERRIDSLTAEEARTEWLPKTTIAVGGTVHPRDTLNVAQPFSDGSLLKSGARTSSLGTGETLAVVQHLPGGGHVSAGVSLGQQRYIEPDDSTPYGSAVALSFTQPLLRDAWSNDPVARTVKIAGLENQQADLQRKKEYLSYCSDIRAQYWKLYEAQLLIALYRTEHEYAREYAEMMVKRYSIGLATTLDTLNARLQLVNAAALLHDAESDEMQIRDEFAFYTGIARDSAVVDSGLPLSCASLPAVDEFLRRAEEYDPQLRVFKVAAERLNELRARTRNTLLPRVDFSLGWHRTNEQGSSGAERVVENSVIGLIASYSFPVRKSKLALQGTEASVVKNEYEKKRYRAQLALRVRELTRSWERERRAVAIAQTARELARQTWEASREGFAAGTVDRLSFEKAESGFRTASVNLLKKQLVMKQLEIVFDEMTGTTLSRFGVELQ